MTPAELVRPSIHKLVQHDHCDWGYQQWICRDDLHRYTTKLIENMLAEERGELGKLDEEVLESLRENELIVKNLNEEIAIAKTVGERLSDQIASFGGSWNFILIFIGILILWIIINSIAFLGWHFDPYPFILLNLVLSCVAALQAPIILMSQNRQEKRDRLQAEQDYKVNLKAELEIRLLVAKIDQLRHHQWQRLLEIQKIQTDLMQEILSQREN